MARMNILPRDRGVWTAGALLALAFPGCNPPPGPAGGAAASPASPASASAPAPVSALPEWSKGEALTRLSDEKLSLAAAIRLVRLSGRSTLAVPAQGPPPQGLKVVKLSPDCWCIGHAAEHDRLSAPVLIHRDGTVELPFEGFEEEVGVLSCSANTDRFPHLFVSPTRVRILRPEGLLDALACADRAGGRFAARHDGDYPYLALLAPSPATEPEDRGRLLPDEAARYEWDGYESVFMGPALDLMPGGSEKFEMDLSASGAFVPVGGRFPEPRQANTPRPPAPPASDLGPF